MSRHVLPLLLATGCGWLSPAEPAPVAQLNAEPPLIDPSSTTMPGDLVCRDEGSTLGCFVPVPATTFTMGAQATDPTAPGHDPDADPDEAPVHPVTLPAYWIQRDEVHVIAYQRCLEKGWCREGDAKTGPLFNVGADGQEHHPVNGITWDGARRYCAFLGGRLPTEAEWELAARGAEGRRWPWGDEPGCGTSDLEGEGEWRLDNREGRCEHLGTLIDRDLRGFGPFGTLGQAGNVWEWTADWYGADAYAHHAASDPSGPDTGTLRVQRGGGWMATDPVDLRSARRGAAPPDRQLPDVGFRCAWSADTVPDVPSAP